MLKRFECKIGSGWTGFLNVFDDAIAQAWREDRWTDYFLKRGSPKTDMPGSRTTLSAS